MNWVHAVAPGYGKGYSFEYGPHEIPKGRRSPSMHAHCCPTNFLNVELFII